MASRRLHGRPVDLGAAYFTVADPEFAEPVGRWRDRGPGPAVDRPARRLRERRPRPAPGPMRWAAPGGLRSLVAALAAGLDVRSEREVRQVGPGPQVDGEPADAVVLAMPDPQAAAAARPVLAGGDGRGRPWWRPVIAVAAGWPERTWAPLPAAFVNGHPVLTLVADDGDRRGDGAPVLVAHTTADVARAHDAEPDGAVAPVLGGAARAARRRDPRPGPTPTAGASPPRPRTGTSRSSSPPTASRSPATAGGAPGSRRPGAPARCSAARWPSASPRADPVPREPLASARHAPRAVARRPGPGRARILPAVLPAEPGARRSRRRGPLRARRGGVGRDGRAAAVVRPESTAEVAAVVRVCARHRRPARAPRARAPGCPAGPTPSTAA